MTKAAELQKQLAAANKASGPSSEELERITASEKDKKKLLELEAEARRLSKVINVDNAQQISRLEKVALLECQNTRPYMTDRVSLLFF